jgi:cation diffusion facilitator CzcD-associated flavoprotein CzcO
MNQLGDEPSTAMLLDVIVVGAGQAGLATGHFLRRQGLRFHLFDRAHRIGDSWRHRYDSLVLFSPRANNGLPGLPLDGDSEGYPDKDEIADYLERYAQALNLPRSMGEGIVSLERRADHFVACTSSSRHITSRAVVVATGAFQRSVIPQFASRLPADVMQVAADSYRNPWQIPAGRVLVAGGGATGRQIALELSHSRQVCLSVGRRVTITPQRLFGQDVMVWFDRLGLLRADKATSMGRFVPAHESLPGLHLRSRALWAATSPRANDGRPPSHLVLDGVGMTSCWHSSITGWANCQYPKRSSGRCLRPPSSRTPHLQSGRPAIRCSRRSIAVARCEYEPRSVSEKGGTLLVGRLRRRYFLRFLRGAPTRSPAGITRTDS